MFNSHNDIIKYLIVNKTFTNKWINNNHINLSNIIKNKQIGGGKAEFSVHYLNHIYYFYKHPIDKNFYILYSIDDDDTSCVAIEVDTKSRRANIQNLEGIKKCVSP
jgi:hypothetical protein